MRKKLRNSDLYQNEDGDWEFLLGVQVQGKSGLLHLVAGLQIPPLAKMELKVVRVCHNPPVLIYCPPSLAEHFEAEAEKVLRQAVRAANQMASEDRLIDATRRMRHLHQQVVIR